MLESWVKYEPPLVSLTPSTDELETEVKASLSQPPTGTVDLKSLASIGLKRVFTFPRRVSRKNF
jgi:hypothetical protein